MDLRADHGDVYLSLPRCFRGPITIRTRDDRIAFSPAFGKRTALISDMDGDEEVPFMLPDPWKGFWSGAERFFATGRII
ncbi:hypothetical protein BJV77DRAFT_992325 [Russula vinacea]|nr:hypothetical protein BJV77DRAFT_992325 [Russula vinacea]